MDRYYSRETGSTYLGGVHDGRMPDDAVLISEERYLHVIANPTPGKIRGHDAHGQPILIDRPPAIPTSDELCQQIDATADAARRAVAGDPLRAVEYERAAREAAEFKSAGYPSESVPRAVSAWTLNGRTARQAADSILAEAAAYTEALYRIREARLHAKQAVRTAIAAGNLDTAIESANEAIAMIAEAVEGFGNNVK